MARIRDSSESQYVQSLEVEIVVNILPRLPEPILQAQARPVLAAGNTLIFGHPFSMSIMKNELSGELDANTKFEIGYSIEGRVGVVLRNRAETSLMSIPLKSTGTFVISTRIFSIDHYPSKKVVSVVIIDPTVHEDGKYDAFIVAIVLLAFGFTVSLAFNVSLICNWTTLGIIAAKCRAIYARGRSSEYKIVGKEEDQSVCIQLRERRESDGSEDAVGV
jgi:hypothetical protein